MYPLQLFRRVIGSKHCIQWVASIGVFGIMFQIGIQFGWSSPNVARFSNENSTLVLSPQQASWVVSSMSLGGIVGAILGLIILEFIGTRKILLLSLGTVSVEWACLVVANSAIWLYIARAVGGVALSMAFCTFSMYLGEISPPETRGTLISVATSGINLGMLVSTLTESYFPMHWNSLAYLFSSLMCFILFLWLKDTPYYLVKRGNFEGARKAIVFYNSDCKLEKELDEIKGFAEDNGCHEARNKFEILKNRTIRKSLILVVIIFALPNLSGNLAIMSYMESLMIDSKSELIDSKHFVICVNFIGIVTSFLTFNLLDKFGRKTMLAASGLGVAISLGSLSFHFFLLERIGGWNVFQWLPIMALFFYSASFAIGYTMIPATILSEIFPEYMKSTAACLSFLVWSTVSFTSMKIFQPMVDLTGHTVIILIYALFSLFTAFFAILVLPETKGKTFQQIQDDLNHN